jgi:hypothetical protein
MSDDARLIANWCKPIINEATGERVTWGGLRTLANVYCLDFEASSLSTSGYPIEVGIADAASGELQSWLIRPLPSWAIGGHWDGRAETVHGIAREQLERDGLPVADVIDALNAFAHGGVILSDAPRHDNKWLADLYRAGGYERAPFAIDDLEAFAARLGEKCGITSEAAMMRALHEAETAFPGSHRAGPDARRNAEFLRLIALAGKELNALEKF